LSHGAEEVTESMAMSRCDEPAGAKEIIRHPVDFDTCYVAQRGGELDAQQVLTPPQAWGAEWGWNVLEDGSGIYFRRG